MIGRYSLCGSGEILGHTLYRMVGDRGKRLISLHFQYFLPMYPTAEGFPSGSAVKNLPAMQET